MNILEKYGTDLTAREYITNPAIERDEEIKRAMIVLLTPEKSALLVGKPGIGKTAIVEGISYLIQKGMIPAALQGYRIISVNSTTLLGKIEVDGMETTIISALIDELKNTEKTILFIDEIHTLIGTDKGGSMDLANILKSSLDRGDIKLIGATTDIEYETYILRDRAFLRRFEKIEILEPDQATTVKILLKSVPRIEAKTGIKMKYNEYVTELLISSLVKATDEFKRVYGLAARYPDVSFSLLSQAFSSALYESKTVVGVEDFYNAIKVSRKIYPKNIIKELDDFRIMFKDLCEKEGIELPVITIDMLEKEQTII